MTNLVELVFNAKETGIDNFAGKAKMAMDALDRMEKGATKFSKMFPAAITAGAVAALGTLIGVATRSAQAITELSDSSQQARKDLEALGHGAKSTRTDFNVLVQSVEQLAQLKGEVSAGLGPIKETIKAFQQLGFSVEDIRKKSPKQLFTEIVQIMERGVLTNEQYAAGVRLLGENFKTLIPAAKDGLAQFVSEYENSMLKINEGTTSMLDDMGDKWDALWAKITGGLKKVAVETAGGLVTVGQLSAAAVLQAVSNFDHGGAVGGKAAELRDRLLESRATKNLGGDGSREVEQQEKRLADAQSSKANAERLAGLKNDIRQAFGDDADDVLDDLEGRGARFEDYERTLRRGMRLKERKKRQGGETSRGGSTASSDALQRLGLFRGAEGAIQHVLTRQERELREIKSELRKQTSIAQQVK